MNGTRVRRLQVFEWMGIPNEVQTTFSHLVFEQVKPELVYADSHCLSYIQRVEIEPPMLMFLKDECQFKPLWMARFEERSVDCKQGNCLDWIDVYGFQVVHTKDPERVFELPLLTVAQWRNQQVAYCSVLQALRAGYLLAFGMRPLEEQILCLADLDLVYAENGVLYHAATKQPLEVKRLTEVFGS